MSKIINKAIEINKNENKKNLMEEHLNKVNKLFNKLNERTL
jgi:hypothetical protein